MTNVPMLGELDACLKAGFIYDHMPLGIYITGSGGEVIYHNPILGEWLGEHLPKWGSLATYLKETPSSRKSEISHEAFETHSHSCPDRIAITLEHNRDGKISQYRIHNYRLADQNGGFALLEMVENLTTQYHLNLALVQARKFENVGRLASGIAHDFNNILQVINGHSEILLGLYGKEERLNRGLDVILSSGLKASSLTRQLLLFSRQQESQFKQLHLQHTFENIYKIVSRMVGEDVNMSLKFEKNKLPILADESQLEQIILNMTVNARDAMPEGGTLSIEAEDINIDEEQCRCSEFTQAGNYVRVTFSDNGCGIRPDDIEHIFDPFFTTKDTGKGSGLGLSTVYSIVKQHHGVIDVQSVVGQGTVFSIYFPAVAPIVLEKEQVEPGTHTDLLLNRRVLIVEDDLLVQDLSNQVLSLHGCQVSIADSIREATELVLTDSFDLYLIDIVLPDGSGIDLIESIREIDPNAAFLLSSGYTEDKPQIKKAIEKGYSFLHKPYTINTLLATCQEVLKK